MTAARQCRGGFVLIGVVMFVLALSILGMSLYAVSGYEAQFMGQTHDETLALFKAQAGLEMVCTQLAIPPYLMSSSRSFEGVEGVTYAVAMQRRTSSTWDSLEAVNFGSDSTVTVIVRARTGDVERQLKARFVPKVRQDCYKRLFTVSRDIVCEAWNVVPQNITDHVVIPPGESVRQGYADSSWAEIADFRTPRMITVDTGIPAPPDTVFIYAHAGGALEPTYVGEKLRFINGGSTAMYFSRPSGPMVTTLYDCNMGLPSSPLDEVKVQGTCVWCVPHGVRFENRIKIERTGSSTATLVIVAGPNNRDFRYGNDSDVGIWFFGGLEVDADVNLILVSGGRVEIDQGVNAINSDSRARNLSIYSGALSLIGPGPGYTCTLSHGTRLDAVIDDLISQGALPRPAGPADSFTLVRGSWQDITP